VSKIGQKQTEYRRRGVFVFNFLNGSQLDFAELR
jgi:hypothetical protein